MKGKVKLCICLCSVFGVQILGMMIFYTPNIQTNHHRKGEDRESRPIRTSLSSKQTLHILSWTDKSSVHKGRWFPPEFDFSTCNPRLTSNTTCTYAHHDRGLLHASDVLLFKGTEMKEHQMPRFRPANQIWVFYDLESPVNIRRHVDFQTFQPDLIQNQFNYSVTYSREADLQLPYGQCHRFETKKSYRPASTASKSDLVAWFVSRCSSPSGREQYVEELTKHIPVHIYGRCGPYNCSRTSQVLCDEMLSKRYKFYLALENSLCEDYISEKFWKCLLLDVVPIVYGAGKYDAVAPPGSFIDIANFRNPKDLADYLLYLDRNDHLYNEYFRWKSQYECGLHKRTHFLCDLCRFLHKVKGQDAHNVDISKLSDINTHCVSKKSFWENL